MIVPRNRLLFWSAVMIPVISMVVADPETIWLGGWPLLAWLVIAVTDASLARSRLKDIAVALPEVVRLSKDRDGQIQIRIENPRQQIRRLTLALRLPAEITSPDPEMIVDLPEGHPSAIVSWPCLALRRGRYLLDRCYLETSSAWGLWATRAAITVNAEVRVYPNVFNERKYLATLFLGRGVLGAHPYRQMGKGRDFEKLREYSPGDSFEDISWKTTAKRGSPVSKVYQIERTQEVYVIIDSSRLSARAASLVSERRLAARRNDSGLTTVLERFVTAALIMGLAAERQGDLFGLVTFSNKILNFVRAKNGKVHYDACREALYMIQPQAVSPDFDELFTFIGHKIRRRALIVILTNMDDPVLAEDFLKSVQIIARRHLVLVNMIQPPAARPLFTNPEVKSPDDLYQELGGHLLWASLRDTQRHLKKRNVAFNTLDNEKMCAELVTQYIQIKQRQAL
ncbi:MAG: DUF58 domain-containing protein [Deltaproteobacteria bacterium]|nr:DUF58 domain-containing protein [Deltaproteobacteria bacterium]